MRRVVTAIGLVLALSAGTNAWLADSPVADAAARGDRASFGCGETDTYTYFDTCFLSQLSEAQDFVRLASQIQACIAVREQVTGVSPASEPQVFIGPQLRPVLALLQFERKAVQPRQ